MLLPGAAAAAAEISIQCSGCSARLKVSVGKLKPAVSQSKCPKCGGIVHLPAAPGLAAAAPPSVPMPVTAQTRRLDPREIGRMLGGMTPAAAGEAAASAAVPLAVEEPLEHSDLDLGRLIDQKVAGLGEDASGKQAAVKPPAAAAPAPAPSVPPAEAISGTTARELDRSGPGPSPRRTSDSGSRRAPQLEQAVPSLTGGSPTRGQSAPTLVGGVVGGAFVGGVLALVGPLLPQNLIARVPESIAALTGARVGVVLVTVLLAGFSGWLGGMARPPASSSEGDPGPPPPPSGFRCTVASGLVGLITGIAFSLVQGRMDPLGTLSWFRDLLVAGLLTAPIARALYPRA